MLLFVQAVLATVTTTKVPSPAKPLLSTLDVILKPCPKSRDAKIRRRAVLDSHVEKNETVVIIPLTMAGQPSAQYTNKTLQASDSHGPLELSQVNGSAADSMPSRSWVAQRGTKCPVIVEFEEKPRQVQNTKMGPLFDIRPNGQGLLGSA